MREPLLTRAFVTLSVAHFLYALSFYLFLHIGGFLLRFEATAFDLGLLGAAMSVAAIGARPPVGRIMDERGRRPILVLGGVLGTIACGAYFLVDAWGPLLYAVRILHGVSEAMLFASLFAVAADIIPASRRIEGIGVFGVSGLLPMAVGGALGDLLIAAGDYDLLFGVATALNLAAVLLSLPVPEPPRAGGEAPRGLLVAVLDPALRPLWICGLLFATALSAYFVLFKAYVEEVEVGTLTHFFATYAIAASALRLVAGSIPERFGPKRVLGVAMGSIAVGLFVVASASAPWHLVVAGGLAGAGHGYAFPILLGLVVDRARGTERGAALAVFTALFDGGVLVGGPMLGGIVNASSYHVMFACAAVLALAGYGALLWLDRRRSASRP